MARPASRASYGKDKTFQARDAPAPSTKWATWSIDDSLNRADVNGEDLVDSGGRNAAGQVYVGLSPVLVDINCDGRSDGWQGPATPSYSDALHRCVSPTCAGAP